jgi:uncharacterized protein YkwD
MIVLINQERAEVGVKPLKENQQLTTSATRKACDMLALNYFNHYSPTGKSPWAFFEEVDYNFRHAGENLARDFETISGAMIALMDSPSHQANIVSRRFKEVGVGHCGRYIVQHFGTKR